MRYTIIALFTLLPSIALAYNPCGSSPVSQGRGYQAVCVCDSNRNCEYQFVYTPPSKPQTTAERLDKIGRPDCKLGIVNGLVDIVCP